MILGQPWVSSGLRWSRRIWLRILESWSSLRSAFLGVEDPYDALLAVVDDHVEVEWDAGWLPSLGSDREPLVSGCEVSDALDQDALPGDPGSGLPFGLGWLLAWWVTVEGLDRELLVGGLDVGLHGLG